MDEDTKDPNSMTDEEIYTMGLEDFQKAVDAESDNRADALDDLRFAKLNEQWPEEVRMQREKEGRPCLTLNKMNTYIRQVVNDARLNKPSIHTHPVDGGADVKTSEVYNGLIRNIEVISSADIAYDTAIDSAVTGGFGYLRVVTDYACDDTFDLDILFKRVANPFTIYGDPNADAGDGSDWNRAFVTEWLTKEEFEKRWPDEDLAGWRDGMSGDEKEHWVDDDRIRVAEYWVRTEVEREIYLLPDGAIWDAEDFNERADIILPGVQPVDRRMTKSYKVMQYMLGGGVVLESNEWPGKYIPIIPVYGDEVNIEGKKYWISLIRHAKDAQRMFNYWRTNATELVALAPKTPFIGAVGSFDTDQSKWATANVETHSYLEYDPVEGAAPPQRQPFAGPAAGALQEALNANDDIKSIIGLHDASLGARSNETSGVAINARKQEGDVSTFHFIDNLNRAIRQAGRVLVDLIPKVYSKPRVIRILGEDMKPQSVRIGPHQPGQPPMQPGMPGQMPDDGSSLIYDLANGKYDVTVKSGPSFTTQREEFAAAVSGFVKAFPPAAPILIDMVAKAQDWPEAEKVARRLETLLPPQIQAMERGEMPVPPQTQMQMQQMAQQGQQMQQQMQQMQEQLQKMAQENEKARFEAEKAFADLEIKKADYAIKQSDVEIARINAASKQQEANAKMFTAVNSVYNPATPEGSQGLPA